MTEAQQFTALGAHCGLGDSLGADARAGEAKLGLVENLGQHLLLTSAGRDKGDVGGLVEDGVAVVV